jgi:excisionase family DNA binding protein
VNPLVLGMADYIRRTGLPRDFVYQAAAEGRLRAIRSGRRWLILASELDDFLHRELERQSSPDPPKEEVR